MLLTIFCQLVDEVIIITTNTTFSTISSTVVCCLVALSCFNDSCGTSLVSSVNMSLTPCLVIPSDCQLYVTECFMMFLSLWFFVCISSVSSSWLHLESPNTVLMSVLCKHHPSCKIVINFFVTNAVQVWSFLAWVTLTNFLIWVVGVHWL